jgi:septin family protein
MSYLDDWASVIERNAERHRLFEETALQDLKNKTEMLIPQAYRNEQLIEAFAAAVQGCCDRRPHFAEQHEIARVKLMTEMLRRMHHS